MNAPGAEFPITLYVTQLRGSINRTTCQGEGEGQWQWPEASAQRAAWAQSSEVNSVLTALKGFQTPSSRGVHTQFISKLVFFTRRLAGSCEAAIVLFLFCPGRRAGGALGGVLLRPWVWLVRLLGSRCGGECISVCRRRRNAIQAACEARGGWPGCAPVLVECVG